MNEATIQQFVHAGMNAQLAVDQATAGAAPGQTMQDVLDVEREAMTPRPSQPVILALTEDVLELLSTSRTLLKLGRLPMSTVQAVKLQVNLEQVGRCCYALADEIRKATR